jgi:hypothetical protein
LSVEHGLEEDSEACVQQESSGTLAESACDPDTVVSDLDLEAELKKEIQQAAAASQSDSNISDVGENNKIGPLQNPVKVENEHELSNSSSLALFDTITLNHFNSPAPSESEDQPPDDNDNEEMKSGAEDDESLTLCGIKAFSRHRTSHHHHHSSCDRERSASSSPSPQKISKRSFSEADKELVINTTAITAALAYGRSGSNSSNVIRIPEGWKREVTASLIFYIRYVYVCVMCD